MRKAHEGWRFARNIEKWQTIHKYISFGQFWSSLQVIDTSMEAYGDRTLYRDPNGYFWEDYMDIGD